MERKYLRMLKGMKKGDLLEWSVYILRCGDGTFYTGIAKDVSARIKQHNLGKGAAYTRTHLPVKLLYEENHMTRSQALIREAQIKRLPRPSKARLISGTLKIRKSITK